MTIDITDPIFNDEDAARRHFEALRWPAGPLCPHCGSIDNATELQGKSTRPGVYKCKDCRQPVTATIGTLYERSHIPLHKWLLATHLMCSSKKGISAHQLWRMLGFGSYRTAWFMAHRIREGMREAHFTEPMGGEGKTVEADEAYIGGKEGNKHKSKRKVRGGTQGKEPVFSLVERDGSVRSFHLPEVTAENLRKVLVAQVDRATFLMTDESKRYGDMSKWFADHQRVAHSMGEYVRGDAHTNTIEGYFATLKRGVMGVYHHVSQQHLKRYLGEFDFRHNYRMKLGYNDAERAALAVKGIEGKRLTYRLPHDRSSDSTTASA